MASIARPSLLPQCTSCTRRFTKLGLEGWKPLQQQVRGKQKQAKPSDTVVVKLLRDKKRFGRAGSYIPVTGAMMRNTWFPRRIADYVPQTQLKQLNAQNVVIERDFNFGVEVESVEAEEDEVSEVAQYVRPVEVDLLNPTRSMELLTIFVPPTIEFSRQPLEAEREQQSRGRLGASGAADILTAAATSQSGTVGIYGSVSTSDVATAIKEILSENDEAARVIISENDIRFLEGTVEGDPTRVKQLGKFRVEIKVRGADAPISRSIRVKAKE